MNGRVRSSPIIGALLLGMLTGCVFDQLGAAEQCADIAADSGEDHRVGGAFATTVDAIRPHLPTDQLDGLPDGTPAVLCWIDGDVPKAPPPGPDGEVHRSFDRAAFAVVNGEQFFLIAGYQDQLEITPP